MEKKDLRFNPRFTKEQIAKIKRKAKREKLSLAAVIRNLVDKFCE